MAATLLLAGVVSVARSQVMDCGSSLGPGQGKTTITGSVVCSQCSLEDARKAQPYNNHLYQLSYRRGQIVLKVTAVDRQAEFETIAWPPQFAVRGPDHLLDRLSAEENLFKEMTIIGLLHSTRTFDVFDVSIKG